MSALPNHPAGCHTPSTAHRPSARLRSLWPAVVACLALLSACGGGGSPANPPAGNAPAPAPAPGPAPSPAPSPAPAPAPSPSPAPAPSPGGQYTVHRLTPPAGSLVHVALALNNNDEVLASTIDTPTAGLNFRSALHVVGVGTTPRAIPLPGNAGFKNGMAVTGKPCLLDDGRAAFSANTDQAGFGYGLQTYWSDSQGVRPLPLPDDDGDAANGNASLIAGCTSAGLVAGHAFMSFKGGHVWNATNGSVAPAGGSAIPAAINSGGEVLVGTGRWINGALVEPSNAASIAPWAYAFTGMNDAGLAVGFTNTLANSVLVGELMLWPAANQPVQRVAPPSGWNSVRSVLLNQRGDILVEAVNSSGSGWFFYTAPGTWTQISATGWKIDSIRAMNERGHLLADVTDSTGKSEWVLLKR